MRFIERRFFVASAVGAAGVLFAACGSSPPAGGGSVTTGPPRTAAWDAYRVRAAQKITASADRAGETFAGTVPERLQSIPVLQVHLNRDGSVREIDVLRVPKFSPQTVDMAKRAVRRAAPFDSPAGLPTPWQFNETFLYNDDLKFQLRSIVEAP